ncbi:single-stranded DNA-binding protein [Polaribacter tangerinus]|uniref:single-stranded DNA-binding protein n=1 Tax=Polaribacter tangerinus TaxID=1920034 RepID=UPI000B4BB234|nr:single-stranded DNA-binding protein [Polaribacter tangerinus]
MNTLRNKVQLIGRLGQEPEIVTFKDGNKMAKFSLATDDSYKNKEGHKVERAYWHNIVITGGLVSVVENYVKKGQEIAVEGKLTNRSYDTKEGEKRYITEIMVHDLLLLGAKQS